MQLLNGVTAKAEIHVLPPDRNASIFGSDLLSVLEQSGWKIPGGLNTDFRLPASLEGVVVLVNHPDFPAAVKLITSLQSMGIKATGQIDTDRKWVADGDLIYIAVGAKPLAVH